MIVLDFYIEAIAAKRRFFDFVGMTRFNQIVGRSVIHAGRILCRIHTALRHILGAEHDACGEGEILLPGRAYGIRVSVIHDVCKLIIRPNIRFRIGVPAQRRGFVCLTVLLYVEINGYPF